MGWADIDTGAENNSTKYYVYGICDADADTFTFVISTDSSTPTGVTYWSRLGTFFNNSASDIAQITNDSGISHEYIKPSATSEGTSFSAGVTYRNTTGHKGMVIWVGNTNHSGGWQEMNQTGKTGETSASTTVARCRIIVSSGSASIDHCTNSMIVPEGFYWSITNSGGDVNGTVGSISRIEFWEI